MNDEDCTCVDCDMERKIVAEFDIPDAPEDDMAFVPTDHEHGPDCYDC